MHVRLGGQWSSVLGRERPLVHHCPHNRCCAERRRRARGSGGACARRRPARDRTRRRVRIVRAGCRDSGRDHRPGHFGWDTDRGETHTDPGRELGGRTCRERPILGRRSQSVATLLHGDGTHARASGARSELITENYFLPGERGVVFSGGMRIFGRRFSVDLAMAGFTEEDGGYCCFPLLNFS